MRDLDYWSPDQPSALALASDQPFACDTLSFEKWLQFVFIPRLRSLAESGSALPCGSEVAAMAEVSFPCTKPGQMTLCGLLREIDGLLNGT